jgi:hypothetical protein
MGLEKVAIKNERPGIMVTPGLRPPDEGPAGPPPTEDKAGTSATKQDE